MVAQIASFTNPEIEYALSINKQGIVDDCKCPDHIIRKRQCKHQRVAQAVVDAEIEKAARFLSLKRDILGMEETARCNREMQSDSRFA